MYNEDSRARAKLVAEYREIGERLEKLCAEKAIDERTLLMLTELTGSVIEKIAKKYDEVKREVGATMVGPVLEYPSKTLYNEGIEEGILQGREESLEKLAAYFLRQDPLLTQEEALHKAREVMK